MATESVRDPGRDAGENGAEDGAEDGTDDVAEDVKDVVHSQPVRAIGRIGLAGYGVVHLLIAWLAVRIAMGSGDKADKTGALATLAANPAGRALLWVITVGLVGLVLWQLAEAVWGHRHVRSTERRTLRRLLSLAEVVLFGVLTYSAGSIAAGGPGNTDADQASVTAALLALPSGPVLVGAVGAGVLVGGFFLIYRGISKAFLRELDLSGADHRARLLAIRLGQVGWPALGVAYGTAGVLVVIAAVRYEPGRATGLDQALKTLAARPLGALLLVVVALGLACFGFFCLFDARYRKA